MNELQIFSFEEQPVRTMLIDEEPWFVGKDVAKILGYQKPRNAVATHVDDEDKKGALIQGDLGGAQEMTMINESGLYSLILSSKLPTAKKFKRWVTSEVLPSIRKHGIYAAGNIIDQIIADPDLGIRMFTELKEARLKNQIQAQQIAEFKPKASYFDVILSCKDAISISTIAKDYGMSAVKMNKLLYEKGVQFKQGHIWLLYQKYAEQGYTSTRTATYAGTNGEIHSKVHTYWTQKGRQFIYDLLKQDGILPLMEREKRE